MIPYRVEFVGGPFCGYVWQPYKSLVETAWPGEEGPLGHGAAVKGSAPVRGSFDEDDELLWAFDIAGVPHLYAWSNDDYWVHNPMLAQITVIPADD